MALSRELKQIKKIYGEKFMHLCRELFPTILEKEGALLDILTSNFSTNSRTLHEDVAKIEFKNFIFSKFRDNIEEKDEKREDTPYELLDLAGYELFECTTEEEIQSFKKYYAEREKLCTFNGGRLKTHFVFFAVRKDVDKIKREDFTNPEREDEYGISVMSIQFSKNDNTSDPSIKCRYNHTISTNPTANNPDATHGNNLNNIIFGLKGSFARLLKERGFQLSDKNQDNLNLRNYVIASDGKYYKYNYEINGIYYCPRNIIIDNGEVIQLESEKEVLIDHFILNTEKKEINLYKRSNIITDSFIDDLTRIEKIEIVKNQKNQGYKTIKIKKQFSDTTIEIIIDQDNNIVQYHNEEITKLEDDFLKYNTRLSKLNLPNLKKAGKRFLFNNLNLKELDLPSLEEIGDYSVTCNKIISKLNLPNLKRIGDDFLMRNTSLEKLNLENATEIGHNFCAFNEIIKHINFPNLKKVGREFLSQNAKLTSLDLPNLIETGTGFLNRNSKINKVNLPNLEKVGSRFLCYNADLTKLSLPNLIEAKSAFLNNNQILDSIFLPKLKQVSESFLYHNLRLKEINLPNLEYEEGSFLEQNISLSSITAPMLKNVGARFLYNNNGIKKLNLPKLEYVSPNFMGKNTELEEAYFPKLRIITGGFLYSASKLRILDAPNIEKCLDKIRRIDFLNTNSKMKKQVESTMQRNENTPIRRLDVLESKDIANLDKDTELTTSEVENAKSFIEKIKDFINKKILHRNMDDKEV